MAYNVHIISFLSLEGIQSLMMCGRVSQAVSIVNRLHPGLFESNQELLFRVLCHQFIETIAGYDTLPGRGGESRENGELEDDSMETESNGIAMIYYAFNSYIHVVTPINLDKDPGAVEQLLLFGRELQNLYNQISKKNHQSGSPGHHQLQTLLQDVFSLLAYADPLSSPVAYLLDPSQREPVTAALNSAILSKRERERERSGGMIIVVMIVV